MNQGYGAWRARVQRGVMALLLALALPALLAQAATPAPAGTVLVMGDSLSAAYGLKPEQGWVALTAARIKDRHPGWRVVNASVSGETTAGGASRLAADLARHKPAVVVIELGANDGLRGLPLEQTRANLERMIIAAKASGARVLLLGMRLPPNFGPQYTQGFEGNYRELAKKHGASLVPFLLEPIARSLDNFQSDNLHPVASAQPKLRDHVWPALEPLLAKPAKKP